MPLHRRSFLSLTASGLLFAAGARAQPTSPIKIGVALGLTGPYAGYAEAMRNGMNLAIEDINAKGGMLGRKAELLVRDSQAKIDLGVTAARNLITGEGVDFLIGPDGGSMAVAVTNVAKQYKKVMINTIAGSPRLTGELFHPYYFTLVPTGIMQGRAAAEDIGKNFKRRIAWIGADYESAHQAFQYFSARLKTVNPNAEIEAQQWPKLGETDFSPYIAGIMSSRPEVLVSYLNGSDIIGFVKQAKPYGLFDAMKFGTTLFLDDIKALGPDLPDGVIAQTYAPALSINTPEMKRFVEHYKSTHGGDIPSDWAVRAYDGVTLLAAGAEAAKSTDSDAVSKAIEGLTFTSLTGPVSFRAIDHQGTVPVFRGITGTSRDLPFKVIKDLQEIPAEAVWPSEKEVLAQRHA